jgi:hypothetical protein
LLLAKFGAGGAGRQRGRNQACAVGGRYGAIPIADGIAAQVLESRDNVVEQVAV